MNRIHIRLLQYAATLCITRRPSRNAARVFSSGMLIAGLFSASGLVAASPAHPAGRAYFAQEDLSVAARQVADWVIDSKDNRGLPFLIVDKRNARSFVFDATGNIKGAASVLLGSAVGDDSAPGIGDKKLKAILPNERTTPAGRFVANLDRDLHGKEILWIDYDAAISLHRVIISNPKEQRAQRLDSPTTDDNRISFGCINVPVDFYVNVVSPAFKKSGIVYVLPETRSLHETFAFYDVSEQARTPVPPSPVQAVGSLPADRMIRLR